MIATLLHIAKASGRVSQSAIDATFLKTTGEALGPREASSAYRSCFFRRGAPSLEQILAGVKDPEERNDLVRGATAIWMETGLDSIEGTQKLEQVMDLLGLSADQVAETLDPDVETSTPRIFRELRRTTSSCMTYVARSISASH